MSPQSSACYRSTWCSLFRQLLTNQTDKSCLAVYLYDALVRCLQCTMCPGMQQTNKQPMYSVLISRCWSSELGAPEVVRQWVPSHQTSRNTQQPHLLQQCQQWDNHLMAADRMKPLTTGNICRWLKVVHKILRSRVRTIPVLGYWVLANICWYWYRHNTFFSNRAQYWADNSLGCHLATHDDLISCNSLWSRQLLQCEKSCGLRDRYIEA